ncbi:MAG TPA: amidohydrolase family protein [Longimicrobiales bacterium]|nr:amidohydrolase family protein [Longimicrobiales bacterium]
MRHAPASILPLALAVSLALPQPRALAAQVRAEPPLEVLHGFTLIDGSGGPPVPDAAIAVRGSRIVMVGTRRELLESPSARNAIVVDLGGGWVVPGLVDAHVHLSTSPDRETAEAELYRMLYAGITAVRDMAGDARALASLARDSRLGEIEAPDVYFSAVVAGPPFFADPRPQAAAAGERAGEVPWIQAITPTTDPELAVALARGTYATGLKIYADLDAATVRALTEEAHRQGMQVWAHSMVFPARPLEVVEAGVDVVSHVCTMAWEAMADAPRRSDEDRVPRYEAFSATSPVFGQLFAAMRSRGTILDATLAMYARAERATSLAPGTRPAAGCDTAFARDLVREAAAAGVKIAAGTDFSTPPDDPFPALHLELEELVEQGGLTPMQAIVAATSMGAEAIGIESTHGLIAEGRRLDMVLLEADPLADISNMRKIRAAWKNAVRYERDAYRSRFPEPVSEQQPVAAASGIASPRAMLEGWLDMWRRYDLDRADQLLLADDALTWFPSDGEELIEGHEAVRAYLERIGFVSGGFLPENELWVEQATISDFGDSAVIGGLWYFGRRADRERAARGNLTLVLVREGAGWRIAHVSFGRYGPAR